jgi:hypothetical protein
MPLPPTSRRRYDCAGGLPPFLPPLYDVGDKKVMVLDEFDIHPEKESQRRIVDRDRTYFLTKYFCI